MRTGLFLVNNYKQALELIRDAPTIARTMDALGVKGPHEFKEWLEEERRCLDSLENEPLVEVWQMSYVDKLRELQTAE